MDPHDQSFPSKPPVSAYFATAFFSSGSAASTASSTTLASSAAGGSPFSFLAGYFNGAVFFAAGLLDSTDVGGLSPAKTGGPYALRAITDGFFCFSASSMASAIFASFSSGSS